MGKVAPSSAGVVYDESGNSNDAQLVNSNCLNCDGTMYATLTGTTFAIGETLGILATFNVTAPSYILADNANRGINVNNGQMYINCGGTIRTINTGISDSDFHLMSIYRRTSADYDVYVDGVLKGTSGSADTELLLTYISKRPAGTSYVGKIAHLEKTNGFNINMAEGGLTEKLSNIGSGGDATLYNATYPTLWALQDVFHYNFLNGFDLYENGNAGEEIRVPIGHAFSQSGYTLTSSNVAGTWHNGAETEMDLDDTLKAVVDGDITDPLGYDDFEENYNATNTAFSNVTENKKGKLVFYSTARTTEEETKILKCLGINPGTLTTIDDEYTLIDGIYTRIGD